MISLIVSWIGFNCSKYVPLLESSEEWINLAQFRYRNAVKYTNWESVLQGQSWTMVLIKERKSNCSDNEDGDWSFHCNKENDRGESIKKADNKSIRNFDRSWGDWVTESRIIDLSISKDNSSSIDLYSTALSKCINRTRDKLASTKIPVGRDFKWIRLYLIELKYNCKISFAVLALEYR